MGNGSLKKLNGRLAIKDDRDYKYLIRTHLRPAATTTVKYWNCNGWWGDQGDTPQCVGYAWAHWIEDGPVEHTGAAPVIPPDVIYSNAQKLDEWPGQDYDGTSVRGAARYLKQTNKVKSYLWAFDLNTLINTVLTKGPVVVGTDWYTDMFYPDNTGLIKVRGLVEGGHAYVINGVDTNKKLFRIKNSWGKSWGKGGLAYISFKDMEFLIKKQGEVCIAVENKF